MFKVNPDSMRMEPTPERVLSVCRLIAHKSMTRDEVHKAMTLEINDSSDQIRSSINVALEELAIISEDIIECEKWSNTLTYKELAMFYDDYDRRVIERRRNE